MKKLLWLLPLPILVFIFWEKKEAKEQQLASAPKISNDKSVSQTKAAFFARRSPLKKNDRGNSCESLGSKLDDIDFNMEVADWLDGISQQTLSECQSPELQNKIKMVQAQCFSEKVEKELCLVELLMLRGLIRAGHITDPQSRDQLADLILAEFSKNPPDFNKLKEFSRRLLDQSPNDPPVQKIWAMSTLIAQGNPRSIKPSVKEEIYRELDPHQIKTDPELRGLDIILQTGLNPDGVEKYSQELLKQDPTDVRSRELLGWSLWQQGRRDEALAQIDAILAQQDDPWLRKLRNDLTAPGATKETYQGRINLGVRLEDLWD